MKEDRVALNGLQSELWYQWEKEKFWARGGD